MTCLLESDYLSNSPVDFKFAMDWLKTGERFYQGYFALKSFSVKQNLKTLKNPMIPRFLFSARLMLLLYAQHTQKTLKDFLNIVYG